MRCQLTGMPELRLGLNDRAIGLEHGTGKSMFHLNITIVSSRICNPFHSCHSYLPYPSIFYEHIWIYLRAFSYLLFCLF